MRQPQGQRPGAYRHLEHRSKITHHGVVYSLDPWVCRRFRILTIVDDYTRESLTLVADPTVNSK
jgi:hypothetical protein